MQRYCQRRQELRLTAKANDPRQSQSALRVPVPSSSQPRSRPATINPPRGGTRTHRSPPRAASAAPRGRRPREEPVLRSTGAALQFRNAPPVRLPVRLPSMLCAQFKLAGLPRRTACSQIAVPKLVCCFESLNYTALNYSQSTTNEGFPTKAATVKKPFLYTNDLISRTLCKEHLNNLMLHLPGGRAVESKYILTFFFKKKCFF